VSRSRILEPVEFDAVRFEVVTFGNGVLPTVCLRHLTALELLATWGAVHGPDLADPRSVFGRRRLAVRRTPVYSSLRTARRAAGCCRSATPRTDDAEPRESSGAIAVWSANAPPAPLGA
jgi:hypothetical protein